MVYPFFTFFKIHKEYQMSRLQLKLSYSLFLMAVSFLQVSKLYPASVH